MGAAICRTRMEHQHAKHSADDWLTAPQLMALFSALVAAQRTGELVLGV